MTGASTAVRPPGRELLELVELVSAQNPLQKKRIQAFLAAQRPGYWDYAEELARTLHRTFLRSEEDRHAAARAYSGLCLELLGEQIRFRKTGRYRTAEAREADEAVYSRPERMRAYVVGLLLTYLFWPNHYELLSFFREHLARRSPGRCLEVGAGHGLFTAEVLKSDPAVEMTIVDISRASLEVGREMLQTFGLAPDRVRFLHSDFLTATLPAAAFDLVVLGEVLEHVEAPAEFLSRARAALAPGGTVFLSTCVNCPAPDHVYLFRSVDEIRTLTGEAGFGTLAEIALPAEDVSEERLRAERITINYAAILERAPGAA